MNLLKGKCFDIKDERNNALALLKINDPPTIFDLATFEFFSTTLQLDYEGPLAAENLLNRPLQIKSFENL